MENKYVCKSEYEGSYVGTLEEINDWLSEESILFNDCIFYRLGKEVTVKLALAEVDNG